MVRFPLGRNTVIVDTVVCGGIFVNHALCSISPFIRNGQKKRGIEVEEGKGKGKKRRREEKRREAIKEQVTAVVADIWALSYQT